MSNGFYDSDVEEEEENGSVYEEEEEEAVMNAPALTTAASAEPEQEKPRTVSWVGSIKFTPEDVRKSFAKKDTITFSAALGTLKVTETRYSHNEDRNQPGNYQLPVSLKARILSASPVLKEVGWAVDCPTVPLNEQEKSAGSGDAHVSFALSGDSGSGWSRQVAPAIVQYGKEVATLAQPATALVVKDGKTRIQIDEPAFTVYNKLVSMQNKQQGATKVPYLDKNKPDELGEVVADAKLAAEARLIVDRMGARTLVYGNVTDAKSFSFALRALPTSEWDSAVGKAMDKPVSLATVHEERFKLSDHYLAARDSGDLPRLKKVAREQGRYELTVQLEAEYLAFPKKQ